MSSPTDRNQIDGLIHAGTAADIAITRIAFRVARNGTTPEAQAAARRLITQRSEGGPNA